MQTKLVQESRNSFCQILFDIVHGLEILYCDLDLDSLFGTSPKGKNEEETDRQTGRQTELVNQSG